MIVIQGKNGKSKVLEDILNNKLRNRNVAIIDTVGVKGLSVPRGVDHFMYDKYTSESAVDIYKTEMFSDYDWIVFEINADISKLDLEQVKELERRSAKSFIITVQRNMLDEVEVYFV